MCTGHITGDEHLFGQRIGRMHGSYKYLSIQQDGNLLSKSNHHLQCPENCEVSGFWITYVPIAKVHLQSVDCQEAFFAHIYGMEWLQRDLADFVIEHCFACPSRLF